MLKLKRLTVGEDIAMLAKSRGYISCAFCFLLFTGAAWAQISSIEGEVKNTDGSPAVGAKILIEREDMKGTYKGAKTDKKGHYIYNGLPLGTYTVSVFIGEDKRDFVQHLRTQLGDPTPCNFDLKKTMEANTATQKAVETGNLSKEQERGLSKEQKEALEKKAKENSAAMAKNKALNDAFNAGKEALTAKNYPVAVESFEKGAALDPNQHVVWANLADAYASLATTQTGDEQTATLGKAIEAFGKAIALKPDDPAYHNNYALALAKAKKFDEAQAELTKAAQLDPPNAGKYFYNLGAVLVNTNQTAAAEAAFKKAIEANPDYADAEFQYATALSAKLTTDKDGKVIAPDGMQAALEKYLQLQPEGQFAEAAKGMLQMIGATIQTNYSNPNAKKPPVKKKPVPTNQ
jgi:tetratricopeptide (TPR) repeat protein